jgi:hypothetical protein
MINEKGLLPKFVTYWALLEQVISLFGGKTLNCSFLKFCCWINLSAVLDFDHFGGTMLKSSTNMYEGRIRQTLVVSPQLENASFYNTSSLLGVK